eukprot:879092-Amorphochlora_amoeboformis.AAC.1
MDASGEDAKNPAENETEAPVSPEGALPATIEGSTDAQLNPESASGIIQQHSIAQTKQCGDLSWKGRPPIRPNLDISFGFCEPHPFPPTIVGASKESTSTPAKAIESRGLGPDGKARDEPADNARDIKSNRSRADGEPEAKAEVKSQVEVQKKAESKTETMVEKIPRAQEKGGQESTTLAQDEAHKVNTHQVNTKVCVHSLTHSQYTKTQPPHTWIYKRPNQTVNAIFLEINAQGDSYSGVVTDNKAPVEVERKAKSDEKVNSLVQEQQVNPGLEERSTF